MTFLPLEIFLIIVSDNQSSLLSLFRLSKEVDLIKPPARETRNALKIVFKIPTKITPKSFYIGTKLWDDLSRDIQRANSIYEFKREIDKQYRNYKDLLKLYG